MKPHFGYTLVWLSALVLTLVGSAFLATQSALADHNGVHSGWQATAERYQALADYYQNGKIVSGYTMRQIKVFGESDISFTRYMEAWADQPLTLIAKYKLR